MKKIAVIDGQGGGVGKVIVEKLRQELGNEQYILALGTNALASSLMLKAGANEAASGENAIVLNSKKVHIILGTLAIISANSMLGELTHKMAQAISDSEALKILIPINKCNIMLCGIKNEPLPHYIEEAVSICKKILKEEE